jgi:hypothetical protein
MTMAGRDLRKCRNFMLTPTYFLLLPVVDYACYSQRSRQNKFSCRIVPLHTLYSSCYPCIVDGRYEGLHGYRDNLA